MESYRSKVAKKYKRHNPWNSMAARSIQQELEEMQSNPSDDFKCLALVSNPRNWQFAIRGPNGTEFAGGIYHGQIKIPEEYPDKPPILTLLTENGRFKTQTEINLFGGIGYFNKYSVRDALLRLIELLPTDPDGALGSVEYDKKIRRDLAIKSREEAPIYGTTERQKLINEIHKYMLSKTPPPVPSNEGGDIWVRSQNDRDKGKVANKHNPHNPWNSMAARSIKQELEEMQSNPSDDFKCLGLTSNPQDWQFAIRGPNGTEFEGGIYHGQIKIPEEYPDKPPILTLLTENGRFKTQTEISIFSPIWPFHRYSVRDVLLELIELLPTYPDGALGSVKYDKKIRRDFAIKSREAAPIYGTTERQKLINKIHEYMLSKVPPLPSNGGGDIQASYQNDLDKRIPGININILVGNTIPSNRGGDIQASNQNDINILVGNTIHANKSEQVGIFGFQNNC